MTYKNTIPFFFEKIIFFKKNYIKIIQMLNKKIILVVDFKSWERLPCVIESVTSLIPPTADKTITCKVKCQIYIQ